MGKMFNKSLIIFSTIVLPMLISFVLISLLNVSLTSMFGSNVVTTVNIRPLNVFDDIKYIAPALVISTVLVTRIVDISINHNSKIIEFDVIVSINDRLKNIDKDIRFFEPVNVKHLRI